MEIPLYDVAPLLQELDRGDVELRFRDGRSIKAHSQKLSLASKGILRHLLEDVLEAEIHAKRRKMDPDGGPAMACVHAMPGLMVRRFR